MSKLAAGAVMGCKLYPSAMSRLPVPTLCHRVAEQRAFRRRLAALVPPPRARPALAPHPRSLSGAGLRVHAAADPGVPGRGSTTSASCDRFPNDPAPGPGPRRPVRESWDGLGYYRRAANLHRLARMVVREADGVIPQRPRRPAASARRGTVHRRSRRLLRLRARDAGGRYQCGPGHSPRLSSPRAGRPEEPAASGTPPQTLVPRPGPPAWTFNQAIMELGALVCTARVVRCEVCPVRLVCTSGRRWQPNPLPE